MKEGEWDLKERLKGLRQRQSRIKPERLTWQQHFHVSQHTSKVIAKSEKKKEQKKNYEGEEDDSRGRGAALGAAAHRGDIR